MTSGRGPILGDAIEDAGEITVTAAVEEEEEDRRDPSPSFLGNNYDDDGGGRAWRTWIR